MPDIHVNIYEGEAFEGRISLIDKGNGVYKLDHPLADPDRVFLRNGDDVNEMILYALMHLSNKLKESNND
jgi:hypothetical protein